MSNNQYRIQTLLASAMLLLFSSNGVFAAEQCTKEGERPLEFRFFTDNNSWKDNGWILECDYESGHKELVWEVPIGSLKYKKKTEVIREAACVPDTATCYLNIFDASGDGLRGGSESGDNNSNNNNNKEATEFEGWFAFLHGATTVATYKELESQSFSELTYCVGPECDQEPQEAGDEDCQDLVYMAMQLDNRPQDTSYQLVCGEEVLWDGKDFNTASAFIEQETCLPKNACCEFIVVDDNSDGLTDGSNGFIYIERNYQTVFQYDGSTGGTFGVMTKKFDCAADSVEEIEEDQEDEEEATGVDEDATVEEQEIEAEAPPPPPSASGDEEMEIEVGDNVDGVADQVLTELVDHYFGGATPDPSAFGTSENWVADDDYQNFNDDGAFFGEFIPNIDGVLWDDVLTTSDPTTDVSTSEPESSSGTTPPTSTITASFDDVVEEDEDDDAWATMDDQAFLPEGERDVDGMIEDLNGQIPRLPSDPNAVAFLNGEGIYAANAVERKVGLSRNAKISLGVLVPLFILWSLGLALYYFRDKLEEKLGALNESSQDSGDSLGKGTDNNDGEETLSGGGSIANDNADDKV